MAGTIHQNIPDNAGNNSFRADPQFECLLRVYLPREILDLVSPYFDKMGSLVGSLLEDLALEADKNPPVLNTRARNGAPDERIVKHPSYVALEKVVFEDFGLAAMSHRSGVFGSEAKLPPLVKYGLVYLFVQAEFGLCCPLSMTDSLTRTLVKFGSDDLISRFFDQLTSQDMDSLFQGSMFMTEQAAGSDVGAIETTARLNGDTWELFGDKWFCSNPDAALGMVLARAEGGGEGTRGLSLFLVPRHLPDGARNAYRILRLKDKLGTRSMASGEIVLEGATGYLVGSLGAGFKQMTDMINMSRLANGVRSAGMMRRSVNEALYIARNRMAFGKRLIDLPLMRRQLIKMLITTEQARTMTFHAARVLQAADNRDEDMRKVLRILTPLIKFRTCRDARKVAGDAMEVRGGCGYIEEWSDARILRDAHLGSIWEGTSNIIALDVARATRREGAVDALESYLATLLEEVDDAQGDRTRLGSALERAVNFMRTVADDKALEADARRAASAVYNAASAVIMAWESVKIAEQSNDVSSVRLEMARLVLKHKLLQQDPLQQTEENSAVTDTLLTESSTSS